MHKLKLKDIKYVFFDMDGTLLTSERKPSPKSIEWINKLKQKGINCSIATGRPYYFAKEEIKVVNPNLPVISCNGALVFDPIKKTLISYSCIKKEIAKKIFDILIENNAVFWVYTKDQMFTYKNEKSNPISAWLQRIHKINNSYEEIERAKITAINDLNKFNICDYEIIKFLIIYSEIPIENYKKIENFISQINDVYIVRSQNEVFDIMPKGLSKGQGLKTLHKKDLIDLDKTLVFGDAENDLSMFEAAKWSVAMGNAQEKTKELAMYITDDNDHDGIVKFLEKLEE